MIVTRDITPRECPWLEKTVLEGTAVFQYPGPTYGLISPDGVAVTLEPITPPFFQLPRAALGPSRAAVTTNWYFTYNTCPECGGSGQVSVYLELSIPGARECEGYETCSLCGGEGIIADKLEEEQHGV